jgi:hypothetical protein
VSVQIIRDCCRTIYSSRIVEEWRASTSLALRSFHEAEHKYELGFDLTIVTVQECTVRITRIQGRSCYPRTSSGEETGWQPMGACGNGQRVRKGKERDFSRGHPVQAHRAYSPTKL